MKYLSLLVSAFAMQLAGVANAQPTSRSQELIVLQAGALPDTAQFVGESMTLHSFGNGSTFLYIEQKAGTGLVVFDVTDLAHIKSVGVISLDSPSAFDFVRDIDDSATLIYFRDNKGAAVMDFRKPRQPSIVRSDAVRQAAHAESIGTVGFLCPQNPAARLTAPSRSQRFRKRQEFDSFFTKDKPVIFNFHSYPALIHKLTYKRRGHANLHIHGYRERVNINTALELAILNQIDRFSLCIDVIDRVPQLQLAAAHVKEWLNDQIIEHLQYAHTEGIDKDEIRNWTWSVQ